MASYPGVAAVAISDQTLANRLQAGDVPDPTAGVTARNDNGGDPADVLAAERVLAVGIFGPAFNASRPAIVELAHGEEFFDRVYVLPRSIDLGIVLATTNTTIDIFNAYRDESRQWTSYDDSAAGAGVSLLSIPSLPTTLARLNGATYSLEVTTEGPPFVDAVIDFGFDGVPPIASITLAFNRSVMFPYRPEAPIVEILEWVTKIRDADGFETRASLRDAPRATLRYEVLIDGHDRRSLENLVFDGQARAYGVPLWHKEAELSADITIGDLTITVLDTTYREFELDGLAVVWQDSETFETLQIDSFDGTTITFKSAFTSAFSAGALVMPVKAALLLDEVGQARWRVNLQADTFSFVVLDNDVSIADVSGYNSYTPTGGVARVLLDDYNFVSGAQVKEAWRRAIRVLDNDTGFPAIFTEQDVSREASQKGFVTKTRAELFKVRGLLHELKGRKKSFYLPSWFPDMEVVADITSADTAITIKDVDYTNLVAQRSPRNVIRLVQVDGTAGDPKLVTASSKPGAGEESISISPDTMGQTVAIADIDRVEYIKKTRFDTDRVEIRHLDSAGNALIQIPVVTVLEGD